MKSIVSRKRPKSTDNDSSSTYVNAKVLDEANRLISSNDEFDSQSITSLVTIDNGNLSGHVKDIDDVLSDLGFGRFHFLILIAMVYIFMTCTYQILLMYYVGENPPWECKVSNNTNVTEFCMKHGNKSIKLTDGEIFKKRCHLSRGQWKYTVDKTYSIVTEYDLVCGKKQKEAIADSVFFVGWAVGGLFIGKLADKIGRKITINVTLFLLLIFTITSSFVHTVWLFSVFRALNGAFIGTCISVTFIYLQELVSSKHRSICVNVVRASAAVSLCCLTLAAYYCRRWRYLNGYMGIPIVLSFFISLILPKSPRWLLANGNREKAEEVLRRIHRINKKTHLKFTLPVPHGFETERLYSYPDLLCRSCKITTIVWAQACLWFTCGLISYALSLEAAHIGGDKYINFILSSVIVVPGNIIGIFSCKRARKASILTSLAITGVISGFTALTFIDRQNGTLKTIRIALAVIGKMTVTISLSGLFIWTTELYSTVVRTQGMTICQFACRIGSAVFPFASVYLIGDYEFCVFTVMCILALMSAVFGLVLPETQGKPTRQNFEDMLNNGTVHELNDPTTEPLLKQKDGNA